MDQLEAVDRPPDSDGPAAPLVDDDRHRVLITLLRAQFLASSIGVGLAFLLYSSPTTRPIFAACAVVLAILGAVAFAPMGYLARARTYSAIFVALSAGLALLAGPQAPTFLVMCGALILPLILLPRGEAYAYLVVCFVLVAIVGWLHVSGMLGIEIPESMLRADSPTPWIGGMITILTISVPFAVLAQRLVTMHREAHDRSEQLVESLRIENAERRMAIEALKRAEQRLTHTQKLELLGQLAGGLAHDMNNALTVIQGEASFLDDDAAETREIILEHANHAAQLTRQLLTLGRRDVLQPKDVDIVDEVKRAAKSIRKLLPSEIEMREIYEIDSATVHADPSQLNQIVLNLVVNARDAMVGGGVLTIRVADAAHAAGFVDLVISDTGHGIAPDTLEWVFEPFYSTKPEGVGTGLGLTNVKEIVGGLGGELDVESEVDVGTTMRVRLPTLERPLQAGDGDDARNHSPRLRGKILLVDDHDSVRRVTRSILEGDGHRVIEASSGAQAIALLTDGVDVDLVITDVVMPEGGGKNVIDWVQHARPRAKLLVISGYAEDERVRRGMRTGEFPFLRKPFSREELLAETQRLLRSIEAD